MKLLPLSHPPSALGATALLLALTACGGGGNGGGGFPLGLLTPPASPTAPVDPAPVDPAPAVNGAPTANAGPAQTAKTGDTVTLDGSASADPDANTLIYSWALTTLPTGSLTTLADPDKATSTFVPDMAGTYVATLTVNDGTVNSTASTVTITVDANLVTAFDSIPSPLPPNMSSIGFQATQRQSVGDTVTLATGTPRALQTVSLVMSSWACENGEWSLGNCDTTPGTSFTHPVTINLYDGSNNPIGTLTQTVTVPYRPSFAGATVCGNVTQWQAADGSCYNGFAFQVEFDLSNQNITLPDTFSYDIVYNTMSYGPSPMNATGDYDSLNVSVYSTPAVVPSVGTQATPGTMRWTGGPSLANRGIMAKIVTHTP